MKNLSILITNWNNRSMLAANINQIHRELCGESYEIAVFDNGSTDGSVEFLSSLQSKADTMVKSVTMVSDNLGQSYSRNSLMAYADSKYVLFLDGDIGIIPGSIKAMLNWLDMNPSSGGVAYNLKSDTHFKEEATLNENVICRRDIVTRQYLYFHYAMYYREFIKQHPLPEFAPFYGPGWGVEEDVALLLNPTSRVDVIQGRKFYHHRNGRSLNFLGSKLASSRVKRQAALALLKTYTVEQVEAVYAGDLPLARPLQLRRAPVCGMAADAAYTLLEKYMPFKIGSPADTDYPSLVMTGALRQHCICIPFNNSAIWLAANEPCPDWSPTAPGWNELTTSPEHEFHNYQDFVNNISGRSEVHTDSVELFILAVLLGFPAMLVANTTTIEAQLAGYGLTPTMSRAQSLAFRELLQQRCAEQVIIPLTAMLLNHVEKAA